MMYGVQLDFWVDLFDSFNVVFLLMQADVLLLCSNAMQYNAPDTIYFRQVGTSLSVILVCVIFFCFILNVGLY